MRSLLAVVLSLSCIAAHADSWGTPDKPKHFTASVLWGAGAKLVCPSCNDLEATALGTIPGLVKEVQDSTKRNGTGWSNRDMLANIAGAYVGTKITGLFITKTKDTTTVSYSMEF